MSRPGARPEPFDLGALQRWMFEVVAHSKGVEAGVESEAARKHIDVPFEQLESVVERSKQLSAKERLDVYANAYFWRLLEIMQMDFPTVECAVGKDLFRGLVERYLDRHPSKHWSLGKLGVPFSSYLRHETGDLEIPEPAFLADVAAIEWAMEEVFDEQRAEPVQLDDLLGVPPDRWAGARVQTIPALRLIECGYPAHEYIAAVRKGECPPVPAPKDDFVAVYRKEFSVYRLQLEREGYALLNALRAGQTLEEALELLADRPETDLERLAANVGAWFQDWASRGLFAKIDFPEA
ncbi:MAG: putative DNA-binding domain-containing protein [Planctomycetes bacterium]|nr:putative DNA-binding domain-containing protein [Planctomycetota bacterium]